MAKQNNASTGSATVKVILQKGKSYQVDGKNVTGEILVDKKEAERLVDVLNVASYLKKASDSS